MFPSLRWLGFCLVLSSALYQVAAIGTSCSAPITRGTAAPGDPFWRQSIKHQGLAAFNPNPSSYQVFRNVRDFGARGDGVTDDTDAINAAISSGSRCGLNCGSSTNTPALVYFPKGTYLISRPIIAYYYSHLIGDARQPPTILAAGNFVGLAMIDADPYIDGGNGAQWYTNQNNFFRSIRNLVLDTRRIPPGVAGTALHWQVSQATSLMNIVFQMSTEPGNNHQGIWMENGSGGYMGDMIFNGGKYGMWVGNQQFTVRNVTFNNAQSAILAHWNWGWNFQGVTINNCGVGFDLITGGLTRETQTVGAEAIIDSVATNTPIFLRTSGQSNSFAGSLMLSNIRLNNVPTAVVTGTGVLLQGGTTTIESWALGNVYNGNNGNPTFTKGPVPAVARPQALLDSAGRFATRTHPQYADYAVSQFVSVKDLGAKGDGRTDDTAALQRVFDQWSGCKIIYFDHGTYIVTSTLNIPAGTQIAGEVWSVISGRGTFFRNINSPQPVVRVGAKGSQGILEITDLMFSVQGTAPGAIIVEWNVKQPYGVQAGAGMWDTHIRLGGVAGSELEMECPKDGSGGIDRCYTSFLALHLTRDSTAYLEGNWIWLSDHSLDVDKVSQISLFSGRGVLSESQGPVWMIGTGSEHHVLYQYNLVNAKDHYLGLPQTETPYFQPSPAAPAPFIVQASWNDPQVSRSAWALVSKNSQNIVVFGAGFYSFFDVYTQDCIALRTCQTDLVNIDANSSVQIYSLSTLGSRYQISYNGAGVVLGERNINGFASTVTVWTT